MNMPVDAARVKTSAQKEFIAALVSEDPDGSILVDGLLSGRHSKGRIEFVFGVMDDVDADAFKHCKLAPTASLYQSELDRMLVAWRLRTPQPAAAVAALASALGMEGPDESVPLPDFRGWALIAADGPRHSLKALRDAYIPQMLDHALALAERGFRVVPLHQAVIRDGRTECTCDPGQRKVAIRDNTVFDPCRTPGKHPRVGKWERLASTDPGQIQRWWKYYGWGKSNVGIATGPGSGFWVLDIDGALGAANLAALVAENGALPATVQARTGSGGSHYFFAWDDDCPIRNTGSQITEKIDVRGDGGQIVAPGSTHKSGGIYAWAPGCSPDEVDVAPAPPWLLKMAFEATKANKKPGAKATTTAKAKPARAGRSTGDGAPAGDGWQRFLALIGDGDGRSGFDNPLYTSACAYFGAEGVEAEAEPLKLALLEAIDAAPVGDDRDNLERYRSDAYLDARIEQGREFIRDNPPKKPADPADLNDVTTRVREIAERFEAEGFDRRDAVTNDAIETDIAALPPAQRKPLIADFAKVLGLGNATRELTGRINAKARADRQDGADDDNQVQVRDGRWFLSFNGEPDDILTDETLFQRMLSDNADGPVWSQGVGLVAMHREAGRVVFEEVGYEAYHSRMTRCVSLVRTNDSGAKSPPRHPHRENTRVVFQQAQEDSRIGPTPVLMPVPTFAPDGVLLTEPGYHPAAGVFNDFGDVVIPTIPDRPTDRDLEWAVGLITGEVLEGFEFRELDANENEIIGVGMSHAMTMLLNPFMRPLYAGPSPCYFITKPDSKAGATLLSQLSPIVFDGQEVLPQHYTGAEDEMRKSIVSIGRSPETHIVYDNMEEFGSRVLLESLTAEFIGGRILGESTNWKRQNRYNWIATGINVPLGNEMARRVCPIRLVNAPGPKTFVHPGLKEWLRANRGEVIAALLTIIRSWVVAGRPTPSDPTTLKHVLMEGFPGWGMAMGGVMEHIGGKSFLHDYRAPATDPEAETWRGYVRTWMVRFGERACSEEELFELTDKVFEGLRPGYDDGEQKAAFSRKLFRLHERKIDIAQGGDAPEVVEVRRVKDGDWRLVPVVAATPEKTDA